MNDEFILENYLKQGVEGIVRDALKATLKNPRQSIFMARYAVSSKNANKLRDEAHERGEHVPPFLIASITSKCNLHCSGCYSRSNKSCTDNIAVDQLSDREWLRIFNEAKELGIGFIILAGGEPLMRPDVIKSAAGVQEILFPVFTNGTMLDDEYMNLISKSCNLIPVLSIEGNEQNTDSRRGIGVYEKLMVIMDKLKESKIIYGASVTVTSENIYDVTGEEFLDKLSSRGCKAVFYVEYVPVDSETSQLAPKENERDLLSRKLLELRLKYDDMLFIWFPGDEKESGGCLAAGRGFFHINSHGGAEPCPFSPYSDTDLRKISLKEALASPLFKKLQHSSLLTEEHKGGCVLFEKEETVQQLMSLNK